jgi:uncharacterized protein (DUF2225 family)
MNPDLFRCEACCTVLKESQVSWTDTSDTDFDHETGHIRHTYAHMAVCPRCFRALKHFSAVAQTLYDIARSHADASK